eukprot:TRINITY_DN226_c0_g1_i2.p2 TRINITY_DN226_c0_g1~~TRINITY_DN226_c0_g1_i2.p2  ORF type:complete len:290 (-),score=89.70 TRINITY_DN226_c0_g1_i2:1402-2271(-)
MPNAFIDIAAGTCGGIAQTLTGHPFNTVKVRLQTSNAFSGGMDCFRTLVKKEGLLGLYKGVSSPLVGLGAVNAVLFMANEFAKRHLADEQGHLSMPRIVAAGVFAGLAQTTVVCPFELVMVRLQTQFIQFEGKQVYKGPVDCAKQLINAGGLRGIYQGMGSTMIREVPNYACFLGGYEFAKRTLTQLNNGKETGLVQLFAGGIAGIVAQLAQLPFDVIKSRIQTSLAPQSFLQTTKALVKSDGVMGFYKGLGPVLLRAFPANAATFFAFEFAKKHLEASFAPKKEMLFA